MGLARLVAGDAARLNNMRLAGAEAGVYGTDCRLRNSWVVKCRVGFHVGLVGSCFWYLRLVCTGAWSAKQFEFEPKCWLTCSPNIDRKWYEFPEDPQ